MSVQIILHGYDFDRLQFRVKAPCEIDLGQLEEVDVINGVAAQLITEHQISPKRLKVFCYLGVPKTRPLNWRYAWYDLKYGDDKSE